MQVELFLYLPVAFIVVCSLRLMWPACISVGLFFSLCPGSLGTPEDYLYKSRDGTPQSPPRPDITMADELVTEKPGLLGSTSSNDTGSAQGNKKSMADTDAKEAEGTVTLPRFIESLLIRL
jgi:hypothetical protein